MLPVPLNSSKTTSSILLPVSTSAVARMVRLPPSLIFLRCTERSALAYEVLPDQDHRIKFVHLVDTVRLYALARRRDTVQQDHDILLDALPDALHAQ